jgi:hypothetical protein
LWTTGRAGGLSSRVRVGRLWCIQRTHRIPCWIMANRNYPVVLLGPTLPLDRCPHCGIAKPLLRSLWSHRQEAPQFDPRNRSWAVYECSACHMLVLAFCQAVLSEGKPVACYPAPRTVAEEIPERPREFLRQASESINQAVGSVMLSASAIDAMLKLKGYKDGSLYVRIDKAAEDHLITKDMAKWAHQVRLDANDQRHADEHAPLPTIEDSQRSLTFALALAEFLFVLPARVTRGIEETKEKK